MAKKREATSLLAVERRRRGWSQAIVVDRMHHAARVRNLPMPTGLNVNYLSKWERGINHPDRYHVHLLCLVFELPSDRLGLPGDATPHGATMTDEDNDTERREFLQVTPLV